VHRPGDGTAQGGGDHIGAPATFEDLAGARRVWPAMCLAGISAPPKRFDRVRRLSVLENGAKTSRYPRIAPISQIGGRRYKGPWCFADGAPPPSGGEASRRRTFSTGTHMTARKILIVDDDPDLREALVEQLSLFEEFEPQEADSATRGVQAARTGHIDLVLMDVGLPDMDGREAVKIMRKSGFSGPIIMLTGHDTDSDQILGLEAGANDYVAKPFKFAVLLARVRAQLRQHEQSEEAVFTIGPYTFRPSAKLLVDGKGGKVRLTEKETSILKFLYRAGDKVITRDVLLHEVWGYNAGITTHTLETHIYRLRQKIEKDPANAQLLITEGGGYKLVP
jgi:DNA-binding response OmpR family regulator